MILATILALVFLTFPAGVFPVAAADAPLGSPDFRASAERPIGWRGDGSGHFPGATPPMSWGYKDGKGSNIAWMTEMPSSPSSVIVAGDRLLATINQYELVCLDKRTGRILWMRTVSPYDAATKEDRAANKEAFEKMDKLAIARDELLAQIPAPGTNSVGKLVGGIEKNNDEIQKLLTETDKEKYKNPGMNWSDGGFMASTPAYDGKFVYAWNGWGVAACFDLDGKRKWIRFDKAQWHEHGHYGSPLPVGDLLITHLGQQHLALNKETGAEVWRTNWLQLPGQSAPCFYASPVITSIGGEKVVVTGEGGLIRAADGKQLTRGWYYGGSPSPITGDGFLLAVDGYFRSPIYYKLPEKTDAPFTPVLKGLSLKISKPDFPTSSPLYNDGLLYVVNVKPMLYVYDVAAEKLVYSNELNFGESPQPERGDRPYGCGVAASPALAGGKIFITGNFGTTLIIEPGREYKEVGRNTIDQRFYHSYKTNMLEGTVSNPFFDGKNIFYRAQKYLYCIGEAVKP